MKRSKATENGWNGFQIPCLRDTTLAAIDETPDYGKTCLSVEHEVGWVEGSITQILSFSDENLLSPQYCDKYGYNVESTQYGWWKMMNKMVEWYPDGNIQHYPYHLLTNEEFCIGQPDRDGDGILDDIESHYIYYLIYDSHYWQQIHQVKRLSRTCLKFMKTPILFPWNKT